jgi:hypothetical protein
MAKVQTARYLAYHTAWWHTSWTLSRTSPCTSIRDLPNRPENLVRNPGRRNDPLLFRTRRHTYIIYRIVSYWSDKVSFSLDKVVTPVSKF